MAINLFEVFHRTVEDALPSLVVTTDQEELAVLNNMGKVVIGCVPHIREVNCGWSVVSGGIDHLA